MKSVWVYYKGGLNAGFDNEINRIAEQHNLKWYGEGISMIEPFERDISFDYTSENNADTFIKELDTKFSNQLRFEKRGS